MRYTDYGTILRFGYDKDIPASVKEEMKQQYGCDDDCLEKLKKDVKEVQKVFLEGQENQRIANIISSMKDRDFLKDDRPPLTEDSIENIVMNTLPSQQPGFEAEVPPKDIRPVPAVSVELQRIFARYGMRIKERSWLIPECADKANDLFSSTVEMLTRNGQPFQIHMERLRYKEEHCHLTTQGRASLFFFPCLSYTEECLESFTNTSNDTLKSFITIAPGNERNELSRQQKQNLTPAMASGLTDLNTL